MAGFVSLFRYSISFYSVLYKNSLTPKFIQINGVLIDFQTFRCSIAKSFYGLTDTFGKLYLISSQQRIVSINGPIDCYSRTI